MNEATVRCVMNKSLAHISGVVLIFGVFAFATLCGNAAHAEMFSSTVYAVQPLDDESERTTSIAFSPDAALIAWATSDKEQGQLFWGYDNYGLKWTKIADINPEGAQVSFSSDSSRLAVASPLSKTKKGSAATGTLEMFSTALSGNVPQHIVQVPTSLWKTALPKYSVLQTVFSPDSTLLAGVCNDRAVRVWNVTDGKTLKTFNIARDVKTLVFTANGELVVAAGAKTKGELQWWNLTTSKMTRKVDVGASFESLFVAEEGATVLSSGSKGVVTFWNAANGAKIKTVTMEHSATSLQAVSPDGAWFAGFVAGENANDLVLSQWDEDGALRLSYSSNRGPQRPVAFAPNTEHIATGGVGGTAPNIDHAMLNVWPVNQ